MIRRQKPLIPEFDPSEGWHEGFIAGLIAGVVGLALAILLIHYFLVS
jgi:hypothetical protein